MKHGTLFVIDTVTPEEIVFSPEKLYLRDLEIRGSEAGIATKYPLAEIPIRIHLRDGDLRPGHHEQVDLSIWAQHFSNSKRIEIECGCRNHRDDRTFLVTGFENYPHLESLSMGGGKLLVAGVRDGARGVMTNLNGIEFCTNLRELEVQDHQITDLTPIKDLPIRRLDISHNPVRSFDPINFRALEELIIDPTQIDLLTDGHVVAPTCSSQPIIMGHDVARTCSSQPIIMGHILTSLKVLSIDDDSNQPVETLCQHPRLVSLAQDHGFTVRESDRYGRLVIRKKK